MAALTTQNIVNAGTAPTFGAAAASDTAEIGSGRNTFVVYKNGSGASVDVTITAPGDTEYGVGNPEKVVAVAAGSEAWIPLRKAYDPADGTGRATITTSAQASVTVAVVRVG
ncbi:hypothetical protein [Streptomyces microflavus]|uniref:hypothetical protein n=1 Tax=Streptomyces microflavus TaxID=1919 RepID=UPI00368CA882